jgi:hypothetical protein
VLREYLRDVVQFQHWELATLLLAFVLENSFCEFDGTIYKQVTGFATGIKCGAEVGSLYLYAMERRFLRRYEQQTVLFKRFIDDGFVMWRGSELELRSFLSQIYEGSGLQLTITISGERVIFLDMEIFRSADFLTLRKFDVRCYQKPMNAYLYLPYRSEHPVHVWESFIVGELIRYVKRCSRPADFLRMKVLFFSRLLLRGYPGGLLRKCFRRVSHSQREQRLALKPDVEDGARVLPLVLTFSQRLYKAGVHTAIRKKFEALLKLDHFRAANFIISWRAAPKIGRKVVTFRFPKARRRQLDSSPEPCVRTRDSTISRFSAAAVNFPVPGDGFSNVQHQFQSSCRTESTSVTIHVSLENNHDKSSRQDSRGMRKQEEQPPDEGPVGPNPDEAM